MNIHSFSTLAILGILTLGLAMPSGRYAVAQHESSNTIAIVVGSAFSERDMSLAMLRRTFRGDPTEFGGTRLLPFNYAPDHPLRRGLDLTVLGMRPDHVGAYWIDRRIRGEGLPPRTVPSPLIMKALINKLPGAIGYLPVELVDESVNVLTIDGKSVRSPDYPVRLR